jgi:integrase
VIIAQHKCSATKTFVDQHPILGGDAIVYRTRQNGDIYQFRTWIPAEKKYYRKTLKTRDLDTALERGKQLFYDIQLQLRTGRKLFGLKVGELVDEFLKYQQQRVTTGVITQGRYHTIKTQLTKHLYEFLGDRNPKVGSNRQINEIDKSKFYNFAQHRRLTSPGVKDVTIRNEQTTLNALFKWGYRNGYVHFETVDFEEIRVRNADRRDTFTFEEWRLIYDYLENDWIDRNNDNDANILKKIIRDFCIIKVNTFMRFGELRQLKWENIRTFTQDEYPDEIFVEINIPSEIAKNRKSRTVMARGGQHFTRLKQASNFTGNKDFIFTDRRTGKIISKKKFYTLWDEILNGAGISREGRKLSFYSLRHFGITARLYAGVSMEDLSRLAGTSYAFIENHYSHVDGKRLMKQIMKDFTLDKDGFVHRP